MLDLMMSESCGEKWYEPSFLNWEEPQGLLVQISFRDLSSLEIRMFLSSTREIYDPCKGKIRKGPVIPQIPSACNIGGGVFFFFFFWGGGVF